MCNRLPQPIPYLPSLLSKDLSSRHDFRCGTFGKVGHRHFVSSLSETAQFPAQSVRTTAPFAVTQVVGCSFTSSCTRRPSSITPPAIPARPCHPDRNPANPKGLGGRENLKTQLWSRPGGRREIQSTNGRLSNIYFESFSATIRAPFSLKCTSS